MQSSKEERLNEKEKGKNNIQKSTSNMTKKLKNNRKYKKRPLAPNSVTTGYGTVNKTPSKHCSKERVL